MKHRETTLALFFLKGRKLKLQKQVPMCWFDSWIALQLKMIKMSPICDQISPFVFLCVEFLFPIVVLLLSCWNFIRNILQFLLSVFLSKFILVGYLHWWRIVVFVLFQLHHNGVRLWKFTAGKVSNFNIFFKGYFCFTYFFIGILRYYRGI